MQYCDCGIQNTHSDDPKVTESSTLDDPKDAIKLCNAMCIRPGLIPSNFSTTHFLILFGSLINMPEGFCSEVTI